MHGVFVFRQATSAMMRYAVLVDDERRLSNGTRFVDAVSMAHDAHHGLGTCARDFRCAYCNEEVALCATNSRNVTPHFRHRRECSCLTVSSTSDYPDHEETARNKISNGLSSFHRRWTGAFPRELTEIRYRYETRTFIADALLDRGRGPVVEFQHSPISETDALARMCAACSNFELGIVWIVDAAAMNTAKSSSEDPSYSGSPKSELERLYDVDHVFFNPPKKKSAIYSSFTKLRLKGAYPPALRGVIKASKTFLSDMKEIAAVSSSSPNVVRILLDPGPSFRGLHEVVVGACASGGDVSREIDRYELFSFPIEWPVSREQLQPFPRNIVDYRDDRLRPFPGLDVLFRTLESLPPSAIFDTEVWGGGTNVGFMVAAAIVGKRLVDCEQDNVRRCVADLFSAWLDRASGYYVASREKRMAWGKHVGSRIGDLPGAYLRWATENLEAPRNELKAKDGLLEIHVEYYLRTRAWESLLLNAREKTKFSKAVRTFGMTGIRALLRRVISQGFEGCEGCEGLRRFDAYSTRREDRTKADCSIRATKRPVKGHYVFDDAGL